MQLFVSNFYRTTFLVIYGMVIMGMVLELGAMSEPLQLQLEANAILNSGWWNGSQLDSHDICSWKGIVCNNAGSITRITITGPYFRTGIQFATLNISAFKNLEWLELSDCGLEGTIPTEIGNLSKLTHLDLSYNFLHGEIPFSLQNLTRLESLDLYSNKIEGSIPHELVFLKNVTALELSCNRINGTLPVSLTNLTKLQVLHISHNIISGEIPPKLGYLPSLKSLDLSYNKLTGKVPIFKQHLVDVNIAFNYLKGPIPDGFPAYALKGNKGVCSDILDIQFKFQFQPCSVHGNNASMAGSNKVRHNELVIVFSVLTFLFIAFLLLVYLRHICTAIENEHAKTTTMSKNEDSFCIWNYDGSITYEEIVRATENFDMKYSIDIGAYGSVYKAQLPSGKVVALKKLHGFEAEVPAFDESFRNEVKVLSKIKHRHLVKLYGFCLHSRIMFLI